MGWTVWQGAGRADYRDVAKRRRQRPEHDLMQQARRAAALKGFKAWHLAQARASQQSAGLPDDIYTGGRRLIAAEYKAGRNKQTPDQLAFQAAWEASGGAYVVVRTVADWLAWLDEEVA